MLQIHCKFNMSKVELVICSQTWSSLGFSFLVNGPSSWFCRPEAPGCPWNTLPNPFPGWLANHALPVPSWTFSLLSSYPHIFPESYLLTAVSPILKYSSLLFLCTAHLTLSSFYWKTSERLVHWRFHFDFSFSQSQLDHGFPTPVQLIFYVSTSFQPLFCLPAFDTVEHLSFGFHSTTVLISLLILRLPFLCLLHWLLFCHSFFFIKNKFI